VSPDTLPERYLRVGGFRRVRGGQYFVEWRDVGRDRVAKAWVELDTPPGGGTAWVTGYEVRPRGGNRIIDYGDMGVYPQTDFESALEAVASWMRRNGTGMSDMEGDFDFS
jgi:hypothetical protein